MASCTAGLPASLLYPLWKLLRRRASCARCHLKDSDLEHAVFLTKAKQTLSASARSNPCKRVAASHGFFWKVETSKQPARTCLVASLFGHDLQQDSWNAKLELQLCRGRPLLLRRPFWPMSLWQPQELTTRPQRKFVVQERAATNNIILLRCQPCQPTARSQDCALCQQLSDG